MRITLILLIFAVSGCSIFDCNRPRRNHSLSKAIETGSTGGSLIERDDDNSGGIILGGAASKKDDPPENRKLEMRNGETEEIDGTVFFSFDVTRSTNVGEQLDDLSRYSLILGMRREQISMSVHAALVDYDFKEGWRYFDDLDDPWGIEAGLSFQGYLNDSENFFQPFIGGGVSYGAMFWSFNKSIYDPTTGEEISGDSCEYLRPSAGVGMEIRLSESFNVSVDLQQDYTIYVEVTGEGFENDLLSDYWTTTVGCRLIWRF